MINSKQIRCARALLGIGQIELAEISGVSLTVIRRIETLESHNPTVNTITKLQTALESKGIKFINNGNEFGVLFSEKNKKI